MLKSKSERERKEKRVLSALCPLVSNAASKLGREQNNEWEWTLKQEYMYFIG